MGAAAQRTNLSATRLHASIKAIRVIIEAVITRPVASFTAIAGASPREEED